MALRVPRWVLNAPQQTHLRRSERLTPRRALGYTMSMTQTKNIEAPASYAEQGSLKGLGDWTIEAIEGDNATLDATISVTGTKELAAAIAALQALMPKMAAAEAFRGEL